MPHPLIDDAIDKSQKVSGMTYGYNNDFNVSAEFVNSEEKLRGLDFEGCIVSGYDIVTLRDKEEGYTGKRGFATAEILDVDCSGLTPTNPSLDKLSATTSSIMAPYEKSKSLTTPVNDSYNMGTGPHIIATFNFDSGTEVVNFPEFYQGNLIARANPTFQLVGVPDETPLLYAAVDQSIKNTLKSSGINSQTELFDVTLDLAYGDNVVRSFDYTSCRVIDYIVKTEHDLEESFYKGFALTHEFHFECLGYFPSNPVYDALSEVSKANTRSSIDWESEQRQSWGLNFRSS